MGNFGVMTLDRVWVWARSLLILMALLAIPAGLLWWEWYKFQDCRAAGHSMLYCAGKVILD